MLTCPQCKKTWPEPHRQCPTCQSDLGLLADFVVGVRGGLERAEAHLRGGELGPAVRAYLDVLEIDPDNPTARTRLAEWARAVRHFDRPPRKRRRRRRTPPPPPAPPPPPGPQVAAPAPSVTPPPPPPPRTLPSSLLILVAVVALTLGLAAGFALGALWEGVHPKPTPTSPAAERPRPAPLPVRGLPSTVQQPEKNSPAGPESSS